MKRLLMSFSLMVSTAAGQGQPVKQQRSYPVVKPSDISALYARNEIAAELAYKDKWLILDGGIIDIERDKNGVAYLRLGKITDTQEMVGGRVTFKPDPSVRCYFDKNMEQQLSAIKVTDVCRPGRSWATLYRGRAQILGFFRGKEIVGEIVSGSPSAIGRSISFFKATHCRILKVFPPSPPQRKTIKRSPPVYITRDFKLFHRRCCRHLSGRSTESMTRSEAVSRGYTPCAICKP